MNHRTQTDWRRVSKAERCPVCGKPDWCLVAGPQGNPTAAICARTESPKQCGEAGWLHVLRDDGPAWPPWRRTIRRAVRMMGDEKPLRDFARLAAECRAALKPEALEALADSLGLSSDSLRRLGVGWSGDRRAWTFPMHNAAGQVVGIRLRLADGRKLSVKGGREGLFLPEGIDRGGRLLVAEGPTDTAALLDLGFQAVGRPSCTGGTQHVVKLAQRLEPSETVVVADADEPGGRGAERLAAVLRLYCRAVRIITPPNGIKDARDWQRAGATTADVQAAIDAAEPRRLHVTAERKGRRHARAKQTR